VIYITAVNNRLLELKAETMPVKIKSQIYVPCSVFNSGELGTYAYYSRESKIATVTDGDKKLTFDMASGTTYDKNGRFYSFHAEYINNTAYLPVYYVVKLVFKDITYTYSRYESFHLVRLSRGEVLSEDEFIEGAKMPIQALLAQYYKSLAAAPTPTGTAAQPSARAYTQAPTPTPGSPTENEDRSGVKVYLAFLGLGEKTAELLDRLDGYGYKACFFASAEQIRAYPDLVRRVCGTGHTLGITIGDSPAEEYGEASRVLLSAARTVVFMTAADKKLSEERLAEAEDLGLIVWSAEPAADSVSAVLARLEKASRRCDIILDGAEPPGKASLARLLGTLELHNYTVARINELAETRLDYDKAH